MELNYEIKPPSLLKMLELIHISAETNRVIILSVTNHKNITSDTPL